MVAGGQEARGSKVAAKSSVGGEKERERSGALEEARCSAEYLTALPMALPLASLALNVTREG